jgi:serine protease
MRRPLPTIVTLLASALALATATPAQAARTAVSPARAFAPRQLIVKFDGERPRTVHLPSGAGVRETAAAMRDNANVAYATPNYVATASAAPFQLPDDSGSLDSTSAPGTVGAWTEKQWSFLPFEGASTAERPTSPGGINAIAAWEHLAAAGRQGARGEQIAVLDTGVAYRSLGRFSISPDFSGNQFLPGRDFVDNDRYPLDENGHGTHVAGTIAEETGNGLGLTGLAYRARIIPVRVLDSQGRGYASTIAKGIDFAINQHADVINMSFNFDCGQRVPQVDEQLRRAYNLGIVTVASGGNLGSESCVSQPATGPHVIGVGGTTEGGCLGSYSLAGPAIDVVAPGGGKPTAGCPSILSRPIYQVTLLGKDPSVFGIPESYVGTSMAAAHVSAVVAMMLASGVVANARGPRARIGQVLRRLTRTARSIGLPQTRQGAGLIDAGAATAPAGVPVAPQPRHSR